MRVADLVDQCIAEGQREEEEFGDVPDEFLGMMVRSGPLQESPCRQSMSARATNGNRRDHIDKTCFCNLKFCRSADGDADEGSRSAADKQQYH